MPHVAKKKSSNTSAERKKLLKILTYERRHGSPIYYRGYEKVLSGELPPEAVMGSSVLQAWIIDVIVRFLHKFLSGNRYQLLYNEVGFKFAPRSWYNLDIAIWDRAKLFEEGIRDKYAQIPPEVVIEIDTKADLEKFSTPQEYFHVKTQDLLNAGVKKVIWIFTREKKLWIAEKDKPWLIVDWDYEISILDGVFMNLGDLTKSD